MPRKSTKPRSTRKPPAKRNARKRNYKPSNTAFAIQRATFTPQTKMVEFVLDQTFLLRGNGTDKDSSALGLRMLLGNPHQGFAYSTTPSDAHPFWGAFDASASKVQSLVPMTDPPPGWGRWLSPASSSTLSEAPYRQGIVVGGSYECRTEMLPRSDNVASEDMARAIAVCSYISTQQPLDSTNATQDLATVETYRGVRRNNLVVPTGMGANGGSSSVAQQSIQKGTWSTKRIFGVSQIKDNIDRFAGEYSGAGDAWAKPIDSPQLVIGYFDRVTDGDSTVLAHKAMPDFLVRLKVKYTMLLTQPNVSFNNVA